MPERTESFLEQLNKANADRHGLRQIITCLSLVVILAVFWSLKLTGIGVAGEAFCGIEEHVHTEQCMEESAPCQLEEHIHVESCYSDITADIETIDDWEDSLAELARGPTTKENVVLVAQSQLGTGESTLNFQVDEHGVRRGITRYGQWYGNPYGDWSAMFVSFCLQYAGAEGAPANAGPESMRLEWEDAGWYQAAGEALPEVGGLLFLRESAETTAAHSVAIITGIDETTITVIEGDVDNAVGQVQYTLEDPAILGYGMIPESPSYSLLAEPPAATKSIAITTNYSTGLISDETRFVFYVQSGGNTYAIDGNGNAVQVYIDDAGRVHTDLADPNQLLWSISSYNNNSWAIQNVATGRYLHPFYNSNNDNGIITPGRWGTSINAAGTDVKFSHSAYVALDLSNGRFRMSRNSGENVTFRVGITRNCTIWLDGTDGGLGYLSGSPNTAYTAQVGGTFQLPETWTSPSKYSYKLRGWYDITNSRYYPAGGEMTVTGNAVLYADWVASTYDIGVFNAQVADTVSTESFITSYMFDYNYLFNIHSSRVQGSVNGNSHSETWSMVTSGNVAHNNQATLDFVFTDNDGEGSLDIPNNRSDRNRYHEATTVTSGIYSPSLGEVLFSTDNLLNPETGQGILGKTYLGAADHLFQIMDDPADEHYGYYYYDSQRNAASYNQTNGRFYVYEYLAATSDSIGGAYADFIPFNSPYANLNGKTVGRYNYGGLHGEYQGVSHYRYDSKYNSGDHNSTNGVYTDYAYGMKMDINFYLPNDPGTGGNKDVYGNDMQFQFSGDDDLWVLIDGQVALDIGGIHQGVSGSIDFSTGEVVVNGVRQRSLMDLGIGHGDHVLTLCYLERGASMSNCAIYFNLAPRFGLQMQKEDVLTQELLDGATFTVYEDFACTQPAVLWESEKAYREDFADGELDAYQSAFTVKNGTAKLWGLGSGNTYYIKETGPPDKDGYEAPSGVIRLTLEREGQATYLVDVIDDAEGNAPSKGFTVHGVKIDEETQTVYLVATNAPSTVTETTTVQVIKKWEDTADHSGDYIQAYLTVTDPDGTVRRIREVTLSDENEWSYLWTNLPKYDYDAMTEVQYGIVESYESGYYSTVRRITEISISKTEWAEALSFQNGQTYLLQSGGRYLATLDNKADTGYRWVDEQTAKSSPNALWTATVNNGLVKFTNQVGQTITFYYNGGNPTDFFATSDPPNQQSRQEFTYGNRNGGLTIAYRQNNTYYYMTSSLNNSQKFGYNTNVNSAMIFNPVCRVEQTDIREFEDWAYEITNIPLPPSNETAMTVRKDWQIPEGFDETLYQEFAVTIRLLANGVNTGRTVTLTLKNNWQDSFQGLPYKDESGNVIQYTVEEVWERPQWTTSYGQVLTSGGSPPTYSTVITNSYYPGGPELPATGSAARLMYVLCGFSIMLGSLVCGIVLRRKRERRVQ